MIGICSCNRLCSYLYFCATWSHLCDFHDSLIVRMSQFYLSGKVLKNICNNWYIYSFSFHLCKYYLALMKQLQSYTPIIAFNKASTAMISCLLPLWIWIEFVAYFLLVYIFWILKCFAKHVSLSLLPTFKKFVFTWTFTERTIHCLKTLLCIIRLSLLANHFSHQMLHIHLFTKMWHDSKVNMSTTHTYKTEYTFSRSHFTYAKNNRKSIQSQASLIKLNTRNISSIWHSYFRSAAL